FDLNVLLQNGQFYEGSLPVHHCPSMSGCRAVIKQTDGSHVFDILENFVLSLKEPNHKSIWLDYLLVIPAAQYTEEVLHELPHDKTAEFIRICGENNFNVLANATGFCKDAAFKLTMDYNNGALECECDFYGSESFECEEFGGQCPCRRNVIGRKCNRCKTGFFGFPDCKPCDCPSTALCDPVSGECICPPRVEGDRCERCAPFTYGFDPIIGCEECQCSPLGVRAGNLQCELETGQCDCKDNVVGRRCERCEAGYWSFPFCQLCDCDLRGTEADICNQVMILRDKCRPCECNENIEVEDPFACDDITGRCLNCLNNTYGDSCERCAPGFYGDAVTLKNCENHQLRPDFLQGTMMPAICYLTLIVMLSCAILEIESITLAIESGSQDMVNPGHSGATSSEHSDLALREVARVSTQNNSSCRVSYGLTPMGR
ncbi:laminin subunit alpha-like, partial [Penaeus monodon]|uniref:laminin subunit alpha-like n=1 Tax=Penaeus monodon TaxID=6687 RepID=UPI0018A77F5D